MRTAVFFLLLMSSITNLAAQPNTISTIAGGGPLDGPALSMNVAGFVPPSDNPNWAAQGLATAPNGDVYFAATAWHAVYKLSGGIATLVAGTPGIYGYNGDNGPAISARLAFPYGVAVDGGGNVYIADAENNRVRKVAATTGVITTVAGTNYHGYYGDGGPAASASLNFPSGVAVDSGGNLYIADQGNGRIRKVSADAAVITTVAGGYYGYGGDGGPATSAALNHPSDVAADKEGNLYIADQFSHRIRKVTAATGVITTVAGNGAYGYSGDNGPAASASLYFPSSVAVDGNGISI